MSRRSIWERICPPWCHRATDTSEEAKLQLERLQASTAEVKQLNGELQEMRMRNHFHALMQGLVRRGPPPLT